MVNGSIGKILVVDDEAELKNILVEALTSQGYQAAGFTSGAEALTALRGEAFDVLLTDLMMPGMDGIALVRESLQIDPHLVCMMMTGQGTIQTAVDAMKEGAFDYVLKPFRLQTVLPVLARAMNTRHMRLENLQLRDTVAIHQLAQTIAFTLDPQQIISQVADAALQQTNADEVSVLLPTSDGSELYVAAVRGENHQRLLGERVPLEGSISSWVMHEGTPLILDGEVNDERFRALWPRPEIRSAILVPMQVANKLVGTININALNRARPFTPGQLKALTILASTAAAALESASLYGQVHQAEEKYRSIFENATEGLFQSTSDGRVLTANPALARILGYDSTEEMIATITDIAHQLYVNPDDRAEGARLQEERGTLEGFELEAYRKDGEKIWVSLNRRSILNQNGKLLYFEGSVEDITERKRTEAKILGEQLFSESIVNSLPGIFYLIDQAGKFTRWNKNFEQVTGYAAEEIATLSPLDLFVGEEKELIAQRIQEVFASGASDAEAHLVSKSGQTTAYYFTGARIDSNGQPCLIGLGLDITERHQAEEALQASERKYRDAFAFAPVGIYQALRDGTLVTANQSLAGMLGYDSVNELLEVNFSRIYLNEDEGDRLIAEYEDRGYATDLELQWKRKDGTPIWAQLTAHAIKGSDGVTEYFEGFVRDITERKQAEEALGESEEQYRDLVENAHDIIYSHDLNGNYTSMNKAGGVITGYTHEEALALNLTQTVAPEYLGEAREMIRKKLAGEKVTAYEMEIIAKDGHRITVEANTKLVFQNGVPVGVQGIARDVTERKQLEDQLRQSQKLEAIGQLAGGVAHDFNNLLTAINGYSSLALQRIDGNPTVQSYLEEIKKAGDRAASLTRQLLAFGRKQILQPLPLNLNDTVTDMNKMLRRLIGEDIQLSAKLATDLKRVKADPGQIEQVLVNLVVNARDAMPQGGSLTIETANTDLDREYASRHDGVHPGVFVVLAVSDTGTGMDEEVKRHIFEPFFTTKEKGKGTGLGLSTVYGIVKQSGGNISIYSEPNHGTTFKVYLPALDSVPKSADVRAVESVIPRGSETVLLVEDEEVVRGLACQILEEAGYRVLVAPQGEEAIRLGNEHAQEIHLLLTDVVMPGSGGREVANHLSSLRPGIKVLFMSGYTDEAIVHHGVLDANVKFIQKPFTPAALARKVREVLDTNGRGPTE